MRVISFLLDRHVVLLGMALIVLGVLASCTQTLASRCNIIADQSTKDRLLELMRPTIEVTRKADGYHYTLEQHLEHNSVSYNDCGSVYQVGFIPNGGVVGGERIEDKITYVLNKKTDKVFHKFTGAATFEALDLSHFEDGILFE